MWTELNGGWPSSCSNVGMRKTLQVLIYAIIAAFLPKAASAPYAIAGEQIQLNGYNLLCDSFNSGDTNRSTNGHYDPAKAGDGAYLGLINGILNSGGVGNADIWGHLDTQVPFTVAIGPQGSIGSTAWHLSGMTGIEPGHHTTNYDAMFPNPVAPFPGLVPTGGTVDGVTYTYILGTDNYDLNTLSLSGNEKMLVYGNASLYVHGNLKVSGNAFIRIEPSASLRLYVGGESANIAGAGILNPGTADGFLYLALAANTSVAFKTSSLVGQIYAPRAAVTVASGGNAGTEFEGLMVVKTLSLSTHLNAHFDEALSQ